MNLQTRLIFLFLFTLCTFLSGCQPSSPRDSLRKSDLVGTKWKLTKLTKNDEVLPIENIPDFLLEFRDDLIGGRLGCNNYQVGWILGSDGRFTLSGPVALTKVGCLASTITLENSFIDVLKGGHTIVQDEDILVIDSTTGELVFEDAK